jgi:hypothetical protein
VTIRALDAEGSIEALHEGYDVVRRDTPQYLDVSIDGLRWSGLGGPTRPEHQCGDRSHCGHAGCDPPLAPVLLHSGVRGFTASAQEAHLRRDLWFDPFHRVANDNRAGRGPAQVALDPEPHIGSAQRSSGSTA